MTVSDDLATLREAVDTLAAAHSEYNKCPLCPLPVESVCVPNCGAWKTSRAALDRVEAEILRLGENLAGCSQSLADANEQYSARLDEQDAEIERLRAGLRAIADRVYPAVYIGEAKDGTKMYGGSDDASRFARALLAEGDGREPDGYRTEGGRVIPTDR